jgi:hypothetical protein
MFVEYMLHLTVMYTIVHQRKNRMQQVQRMSKNEGDAGGLAIERMYYFSYDPT